MSPEFHLYTHMHIDIHKHTDTYTPRHTQRERIKLINNFNTVFKTIKTYLRQSKILRQINDTSEL